MTFLLPADPVDLEVRPASARKRDALRQLFRAEEMMTLAREAGISGAGTACSNFMYKPSRQTGMKR